MHLPPLSSPVISGYYSSGDVSIAGDVVMGSGVILQANPGYCIRINDGVCLGLGVILHASEGNIIVFPGAILGAGVLVIGWAEIGQRACIGSAATVFSTTIAAGQMVAPGSLLGQRGRTAETEVWNDRSPDYLHTEPHTVPGSFSLGHPPQAAANSAPMDFAEPEPPAEQIPDSPIPDSRTTNEPPTQTIEEKNTIVYGKDYFLQLRFAMFPGQS